jgi:hypothetical protein
MFTSGLIRKKDAKLHYELMAHLIRQFGAPPLPALPSPMDSAGMAVQPYPPQLNPHLISNWADNQFEALKRASNMSEYDIEFVPASGSFCTKNVAAARRLEVLAAGRMPYRATKPAVIFYDQESCAVPEQFTARIALKLAQLRLETFQTGSPLSGLQRALMTLNAAGYNRQGFVLIPLVKPVSAYLAAANNNRPISERLVLNMLCFSACLTLRIRRYSHAQIVSAYGAYMRKSIQRKFRDASQQIDTNPDVLKTLQSLSEAPRPAVQSAHTYPYIA